MFANFDSIFGDVFEAKLEIYLGDKLIQSNTIQAPSIVVQQQYYGYLHQIINEPQPMSVKLSVRKDVYDGNNNYVRTLWNSVESYNYKKED
jgi:hypothetical protein